MKRYNYKSLQLDWEGLDDWTAFELALSKWEAWVI